MNRDFNAPLIAAAPDLLAALEQLAFRANLSPEDEWIGTSALSAISKAKGGEQQVRRCWRCEMHTYELVCSRCGERTVPHA